jgi:CheY-like chemotaxis protein
MCGKHRMVHKRHQLLNARDDIDLIVCYLHMPESDGIEFMAHLEAVGSRIPIVIVSSADEY